jgi:hypothetical protein
MSVSVSVSVSSYLFSCRRLKEEKKKTLPVKEGTLYFLSLSLSLYSTVLLIHVQFSYITVNQTGLSLDSTVSLIHVQFSYITVNQIGKLVASTRFLL